MRFSIPAYGAPQIDGIWIRVEGDDLPHPVLFRLGVGEDGQLIATGLLIAAERELTTRAVRLPLASIVSRFAAEVVAKPSTYKRLQAELSGHDFEKDARWRAWTAEGAAPTDFVSHPRTGPVQVPRVRPGRRGYPDDHYRQVAKAYRRAKRQHPRAPIRALMEELNASEPTIHRWIGIARDKGFLKATKEN
jgi:hypothetical protein